MTPDEVKTALSDRAVMGAVQSPGAGSPNRLVYVGSGDGPNTPPPAQGNYAFDVLSKNTRNVFVNIFGNELCDMYCSINF